MNIFSHSKVERNCLNLTCLSDSHNKGSKAQSWLRIQLSSCPAVQFSPILLNLLFNTLQINSLLPFDKSLIHCTQSQTNVNMNGNRSQNQGRRRTDPRYPPQKRVEYIESEESSNWLQGKLTNWQSDKERNQRNEPTIYLFDNLQKASKKRLRSK